MKRAKWFASPEDDKKHDDTIRRPVGTSVGIRAMLTLRGPRKKRILLSLLAFIVVCCFIKYLPTDASISQKTGNDGFYNFGALSPASSPTSSPADVQEAPSKPQGAAKEHYFDGPVKFYHLTAGLHSGLLLDDNARNVLFGISNIKSASNVLPMACEMSKRERNRVHVALLGRHDISIEALKDIYGVLDSDCPVSWYDGRPDVAAYSSDQRMKVSVRAALDHLLYYLKPHAVVVDNAAREDHFLATAVKDASIQANVPVITLPDLAIERLGWLCELDGASIGSWDRLQVEILVHGSPVSSASFIRLLRSIANADYTGTAFPRLTVELPEIIDPPTMAFLSNFRYPPGSSEADSKMVVRRRLSSRHLTPVEVSLRTVESFYPAHVERNHLLVLTADAELSPTYFGFLRYLLLEYKFSNLAKSSRAGAKLLGISLESPPALLNGTKLDLAKVSQVVPAPLFLWQAPNSHAALYFGNIWVELHSFLSRRLNTAPESSSVVTSAATLSSEHPAWMEYLLELARSRAYYMLYPAIKPGESPLVKIHDELHLGEEDGSRAGTFDTMKGNRVSSMGLPVLEVLTGEPEQFTSTRSETPTRNTESITSVLLGMKGNTTLPLLQSLPLLSHDGILVEAEMSKQLSVNFADHFSLSLGGCKSLKDRAQAVPQMADDLFCDEDDFD